VCDTAHAATEVSQILVEGTGAVMLGVLTQTIRATGRGFSTPVAVRITVDDGLITRLRIYEDSYGVSNAFAGHP
jgi:ketosteroid isomerase-like protein